MPRSWKRDFAGRERSFASLRMTRGVNRMAKGASGVMRGSEQDDEGANGIARSGQFALDCEVGNLD